MRRHHICPRLLRLFKAIAVRAVVANEITIDLDSPMPRIVQLFQLPTHFERGLISFGEIGIVAFWIILLSREGT